MLGESGPLRVAYAEALVAASGGQVTPEALQSFEIALNADPDQPKARFYLGLAAEQAGDKAKSLEIFNKLVADARPDAPYLPYVMRHIAEITGQYPQPPRPAGIDALPQGAEAIAALPDAERQAMIRTMVDGLAAKLAASSHDGDGWLRLIRAYSVLKEKALAKTALADARKAMADDAGALQKIDALAADLGLDAP